MLLLLPGQKCKVSTPRRVTLSQVAFQLKWPSLLFQAIVVLALHQWDGTGQGPRPGVQVAAALAADGYVSRGMSMPVPENPDYSDQLYSFNSFNPETYITDSETWCRTNLPALPKVSRLMCETFPRSTVLMAYQGTRAGVQNCKQAFSEERWRCDGLSPYADSTGLLSLFENSPIMNTHSKEQATIEAFVGAGAAVTVARGCGDGYLSTECSCGEGEEIAPPSSSDPKLSSQTRMEPPKTVALEGCHHNFKVGYNLAHEFLSTLFKSLAKRQSDMFAVTRHNVAVGVVTAMRSHQIKCACHGESGSCSIKTCWVQPHDMKTIAQTLKKKHHSMRKVEVTSVRSLVLSTDNIYMSSNTPAKARKVHLPVWTGQDSLFNQLFLVYANKSHDYCKPNPITQGMVGRECPAGKTELDCDLWCCLSEDMLAGGYKKGSMIETRNVQLEFDCDCKFNFCCNVKCQVCHRNETKRFCKAPPPSGGAARRSEVKLA